MQSWWSKLDTQVKFYHKCRLPKAPHYAIAFSLFELTSTDMAFFSLSVSMASLTELFFNSATFTGFFYWITIEKKKKKKNFPNTVGKVFSSYITLVLIYYFFGHLVIENAFNFVSKTIIIF